jgi:hypothetical protein
MDIISRKEAKEKGLTRYFTGKPCKYGHVSNRHVVNAGCSECMKKTQRQWRQEKPEYMEQYRQNNKDAIKKSTKQYYQKNIEKYRKYSQQYCKENPDKVNAKASKRRATKLQRTPLWGDINRIKGFYKLAKIMSDLCKEPYHVDHIVPMQGKIVCGLHVPENMQVLPASLNISKNNQWNWETQSHE